MRNLVADSGHADLLNELRRELEDRMAALKDSFQACAWYERNWTRDRVILRSATMP